jgi:catecholate siderophore receptor
MSAKLSFKIAVTTATLSGLAASPALAADLGDARLAVIDRALRVTRVHARSLVQDSIAIEPAEQTQTYQFNIEGAPLQDVVAAFQRVTGGTVTVSTDSINPIFSPGLKGVFTFEQGLRMLLEGTSITFRLTGVNAAMLTLPSLSESVSVSATSTRVVESPKYQAPLREIPQTIEVIPRAAMEAQGVTTLSEALRNVPGITMQAGEGGGASSTAGDMFNMRGFSAANSLFVDNVRDDGLVSRDVFNLEQVEVFLGPTGSDVGRGNAAGYVNMQTKRPSLNNGTAATLAFGTASQRRGTVDFNQSLSSGGSRWIDKAAFRLNAMWQDSGVPGRSEVTNESRAVAPSLALGIGTSTRVIASSQILRQDNIPDYGLPTAAWRENQLGATATQPQASRDVDQTIFFGSPGHDYDRADQTSALFRVERDLSPRLTITNQTRYNATNREAVVTAIQNVAAFVPATETVTLSRQANARENAITSNQTNLVARFGSGAMEHAFNAGLEFINEDFNQPTLIGMGTRAPVSIYNPNPNDPVTGMNITRNGAFSAGDVQTVAGYVSDSFSVTSKVRVNGSLRVERYDAAYQTVNDQQVTTLDQASQDTLVSGKIGAIYRLSPTGNVYLSYGTTMTPPGSVNFAFSATANNQNNANTDPQVSSNLEGGVKWDVLGGRLALTGAIFHTVNKNVLFTVDSTTVPPIFNQDDKQQVNGVTVGATGQITRDWQVMTSLAYLDSESLSQGPNNGMRLTLSPEWSGSIWTSYRLPKNFAIAGGVRGTTSTFYNTVNTIQAPGYKVVDALLEYMVNAHLTLRMNVYNLTDEIYVRNINNNGGRYNPGFRRTAQVTTVIAF